MYVTTRAFFLCLLLEFCSLAHSSTRDARFALYATDTRNGHTQGLGLAPVEAWLRGGGSSGSSGSGSLSVAALVTEDMPVEPHFGWTTALARAAKAGGAPTFAVDCACVVPQVSLRPLATHLLTY